MKLPNDMIQEELEELAKEFYRIFETDQGKYILDHLKEVIEGSYLFYNPVTDISINLKPSELMMIREGQNSVLRYINRMIKIHKDIT